MTWKVTKSSHNGVPGVLLPTTIAQRHQAVNVSLRQKFNVPPIPDQCSTQSVEDIVQRKTGPRFPGARLADQPGKFTLLLQRVGPVQVPIAERSSGAPK
jgi:hypothetical protein